MANHANDECATCGGYDNHPKHHYADPSSGQVTTYHHDCLPAAVERDVTALDGEHPQHTANARIIKAAKSGKHGDELRAWIHADHAKTTAPQLAKHLAKLEREATTVTMGGQA